MKKVVFGLMVMMAALSSQASYMLWQVDTGDYSSLGRSDINAYQLLATTSGAATEGTVIAQTMTAGQPMQIDLTSYSTGGYSFYVELVNYDTTAGQIQEVIGRSNNAATYTSLAENGFVVSSLSEIQGISNAFHNADGGYKEVPEPTSAMLLALGVAFLSLKRRVA